MNKIIISPRLTRKVWKKLAESNAPVSRYSDLKNSINFSAEYTDLLNSNSYFPQVPYGYIGLEKNLGVTRFIPILKKEDMAVYYQLCAEIGDQVIENIDGIYGGWKFVKTPGSLRELSQELKLEEISKAYHQGYFSETFSSAAWFQQYKSYTDLITRICSQETDSFIAKTDIANFYDSIDISILMQKLQRKIPDYWRHLDLLEIFLGHWNRNTLGYKRSSKGIPQEILSDASRNLSHFYLSDFDRLVIEFAERHNIKYIRWADDILFIGRSPRKLEDIIYFASQTLLKDGLNLNASKTSIFHVREFARYRALDILRTVADKDIESFRKELQKGLQWSSKPGKTIKIDTVFRASLGLFGEFPDLVTKKEHRFWMETLNKNQNLLGSLNSRQMYRLIKLSGNPLKSFRIITYSAKQKQATAPKAALLSLIRTAKNQLNNLKISDTELKTAITSIFHSTDDPVIRDICVQEALAKFR